MCMNLLFQLIISNLIAILLASFSLPPDSSEIWLVNKNSSLWVDGKTNINSFSCLIQNYNKYDTITFEVKKTILNQFKTIGRLDLTVGEFDCKLQIMTKDLQKTFKSKEYPFMYIKFTFFSNLPSTLLKNQVIKGNAEITLVGKTRKYEIEYIVYSGGNNEIELTGSRQVLFSEFDLKAPSKLGGIIKVKDELEVEVNLQLKRLQ